VIGDLLDDTKVHDLSPLILINAAIIVGGLFGTFVYAARWKKRFGSLDYVVDIPEDQRYVTFKEWMAGKKVSDPSRLG